MDTLQKYAVESRTYRFCLGYVPEIAGGDSIAVVQSVTATPSGLTIGTPVTEGINVYFTISGGVAGTTYTVACVVQTISGAVIEGKGYLQVN